MWQFYDCQIFITLNFNYKINELDVICLKNIIQNNMYWDTSNNASKMPTISNKN